MAIKEYVVQTKNDGWYVLSFSSTLGVGGFTRVKVLVEGDANKIGNSYDILSFKQGNTDVKKDGIDPKKLKDCSILIDGFQKPTAPIIKVFEQIE